MDVVYHMFAILRRPPQVFMRLSGEIGGAANCNFGLGVIAYVFTRKEEMG